MLIIGCGYLGIRAADAWIALGKNVSALTRTEQNAAKLRERGITPVIGDVTDADSLSNLPESDVTLYAVGFDRASGKTMREVYVDGLRNALAVLQKRTRRFIDISSTSVYGQQAGELVDESSPCEPIRENGMTCLEAEAVVWRHFPDDTNSAAGAILLRLAGIYGPGRLLSRIETLKSGEPLAGNPDAWLNLIHVDDAVQTVLACAEGGRVGQTYLVADDRPVRRREYYSLLASLVSAPAPTFADPKPVAGGVSFNKRCMNRKLRTELKVELQFPTIEEGIRDAVRDV